MTKLEEVATAIYACRCRTNNIRADWDALPMEERVCLKVEVRAAIEAIRTATPDMLREGESRIDWTNQYGLQLAWDAMIDAILSEAPDDKA